MKQTVGKLEGCLPVAARPGRAQVGALSHNQVIYFTQISTSVLFSFYQDYIIASALFLWGYSSRIYWTSQTGAWLRPPWRKKVKQTVAKREGCSPVASTGASTVWVPSDISRNPGSDDV